MEEEAGKGKKAPKAVWLDLLDPITELILERLPLRDYIRFAAVCRKWRSVQRAHRLRHAPGPPPMAHPLPWLIPYVLAQDSPLLCYSPLDQTFYSLHLSTAARHSFAFSSSHSWLLLLDGDSARYSLFNPISGAHILLPLLVHSGPAYPLIGAMSAPASDPQCTLLLVHANDIFLYLVNDADSDRRCMKLPFPRDETRRLPLDSFHSIVYCGSKFYCVSSWFKLYVVDPHGPSVSVQLVEMGGGQLRLVPPFYRLYLVECDGEILVLVAIRDFNSVVNGFRVFRADISRNMWVKVGSLGDRVLFVAGKGTFSLLAADVGCKKNCIYSTYFLGDLSDAHDEYLYDRRKQYWIFDLETECMIYELPVLDPATGQDLLRLDGYHLHWVVPRLDYVNPAEASNFERIIAEDS